MAEDRRLIEDYLPIEAIGKEIVSKGHPFAIHYWWARRPLLAARAAVYGALVPTKVFLPPHGTDAEKAHGHERCREFIQALCKYPGDPKIIAQAQLQILAAHAESLSARQVRR